MRTLILLVAAPVLLAAPSAMARDKCIAVMELVGVPANVAQATDEVGDDSNGDGEIWLSMGGGRMFGYLDCGDMPGSQHGDMYQQDYSGGAPRKTGNSQAAGQLGRKWFTDSAQRHSTSSGSTGAGRSSSSGTASDDRPPQNSSPIAKKKKPVAQTQR